MIEVEEETYKQLLKDASDNRSLIRMVKYGLIFAFFMIVLLIYGIKIIDISLIKMRTSAECQAAILKAENNVRVRELESAGMTTNEYLKWLKITSMEKEE